MFQMLLYLFTKKIMYLYKRPITERRAGIFFLENLAGEINKKEFQRPKKSTVGISKARAVKKFRTAHFLSRFAIILGGNLTQKTCT